MAIIDGNKIEFQSDRIKVGNYFQRIYRLNNVADGDHVVIQGMSDIKVAFANTGGGGSGQNVSTTRNSPAGGDVTLNTSGAGGDMCLLAIGR